MTLVDTRAARLLRYTAEHLALVGLLVVMVPLFGIRAG